MTPTTVIELFSGTGSFTKIAKQNFCISFTYDNHQDATDHGLHTNCDILDPTISYPDVTNGIIWASPPCEGFSVASIGKMWTKDLPRRPKHPTAENGLKLLDRTVSLIAELKPKYWFIENPRGMMRKVIHEVFEKHGVECPRQATVYYCKYGDTRMKPTDIWTNCMTWKLREKCRFYRYDKETGKIIDKHCHHESARRGATTGTQGIKGYLNKSVIPPAVFQDIFRDIAGHING